MQPPQSSVNLSMSRPEHEARPLLFCPFCRECFEGAQQCPEHELALVPFEALPREEEPDSLPAHDAPVAAYEWRFGRGLVALAMALSIAGFSMPVLEVATASASRVFTGWQAATSNAPNLWTVPFVAALFGWILARRRTPAAMRGTRLVAILCGLAPIAALAYTMFKVRSGAAQWSARTSEAMEIAFAPGVYLIVAASVLYVIGGARLGVVPLPRSRSRHLSSS